MLFVWPRPSWVTIGRPLANLRLVADFGWRTTTKPIKVSFAFFRRAALPSKPPEKPVSQAPTSEEFERGQTGSPTANELDYTASVAAEHSGKLRYLAALRELIDALHAAEVEMTITDRLDRAALRAAELLRAVDGGQAARHSIGMHHLPCRGELTDMRTFQHDGVPRRLDPPVRTHRHLADRSALQHRADATSPGSLSLEP
jgi:hypothetical protein